MWERERLRPPFVMLDQEFTDPIAAINMKPGVNGAHMIVRWKGHPIGRLWFTRYDYGGSIPASVVSDVIRKNTGWMVEQMTVQMALENRTSPAPTPDLTVVVCTRNHPDLLRRCLAALVAMRDARLAHGPAIDLLVVDNAPPDDSTKRVTAEFPGVRYTMEPVPGLDFGRNRAIDSTERAWLAFVDDDAVVDRFWLDRLSEDMQRYPDAACFTGPILPLMLETEAQLRFEWMGGFGKGFIGCRYGTERWGDPLYPTAAGNFGTGATMAMSVKVLRQLGKFDEALDTGPPLPGGGDTDMFYRIIRAGHPLVYCSGLMVHHEHRRDNEGLRKQYKSWGLAIMALLRKSMETDPDMNARQRRLIRAYGKSKIKALAGSLLGRGASFPSFVTAEIMGAIQGYFGEYQRSQKRIEERKRKVQS